MGCSPFCPELWSRRGERKGELAPPAGPSVQTSRECTSPPHKWTGPGPNHRNWIERGKEEGRKKSCSKLPPPFSQLCNLLISFRWETGALFPRERGGASLPGRMRRGAAPFSLPQSRGPSLPPSSKRRVGGLAATSLASCAIQPRPHASGSRSLRSAAGRVSSTQCLVSPGPLRPQCCGRVCAPGVAGADYAPCSPLAPGFAWENPLFMMPLGDGVEGGRWATGALDRDSWSAFLPQASLK